MTRLLGFAVIFVSFGSGISRADEPPPPTPIAGVETSEVQFGSPRSTAEEFLVLPDGVDLGARVRTITADDGLGVGQLKLTDVALFDVQAQWAFAHHFELDAIGSVLAKQPSETDEHVLQGGALTIRRDLVHRTALALTGSVAPLVGLHGAAYGGALFATHKHRLNEIVTFALSAGADATWVRPTGEDRPPWLVEAAGHAAVLVRIPNGVWGGWLDIGYALPVAHGGIDPVSAMALDPQPRLDIAIGTAVQLADRWDLSFELSILDRGDTSNPATELPILDGGFDQVQLVVGVSRRIKIDHDHGVSDPLQML